MSSPFIVEIAIEPANPADRAKLRRALDRLLDGDGSLAASDDEEAGRTTVRATDEFRLNATITQLQQELDQRLKVGTPQAAYRARFGHAADIDYTYKEQSDCSGQFGRIKFTVEPGQRGQGIIFRDEVKGGSLPRDYIPSIEKGIREAAATGSPSGFPIIDFTATLHDGAYHDLDSSALAFEIAARGGMREAAQKAGIKLLEPIMKVVVLAPNGWREAIVADLADRRAVFERQGDGSLCVVVALAPMAWLFGYAEALATATQDEARSVMLLDHYEDVPAGGMFPYDSFPAAAALRA